MKKKLTSLLLVLTILFTLMPAQVFASNNTAQASSLDHANQVHVIVENTTFTKETAEALGASWEDSYWSGTLVDEWVTIDDDSTMMSCVVTALNKNGLSQTGAESNYIEAINGLSAFDGGWMSGWMGSLNDWLTNQGFGAYTVSDGTLEAGDEIRIMYTCEYGSDLGGSWGNNDSTLKNISFNVGTLSPAFDSATSTYTLTVPVGTQSIVVTPTANNKNFQTRTRINDTVYKRTANVPVTHGTTLTVECNWDGSESMNSGAEAHSYTIGVEYEHVKANVAAVEKKINNIGTVTLNSSTKITQARTAYDKLTDLEKSLVTNYSTLASAETQYGDLLISDAITKIDKIGTVTLDSNKTLSNANKAYNKLTDVQKTQVTNSSVLEAANTSYDSLIKAASANALFETENYIINKVTAPIVGSVGGEWAIIGLARNEASVPTDYYSNYYQKVEAYVTEKILADEKLHTTKSTENSRLIVSLASIGKDPRNVAGHNLLEGLTDMNYVKKQGINGPIWALIAFNTKNYDIPTAKEGQTQVTRDALIQYILSKELATGGWALSGTAADPDMTGMALQALAPYYNTNTDVKAAIDRALNVLSNIQLADGGYASWGTTNSESCAQVITALSALGIDIKKDTRFIKNNHTLYDALMNFYVKDGGFRNTLDGTLNQMATEQAFYSIVAYNRMISGKPSLYDMCDVGKKLPTIIQENNSIKLEMEATTFPKDTVVKQESITTGEIYHRVETALKNDANKFTVIELNATHNNVKVQPNGKVKLTIPVPATYDLNKVALYYVAEDGSKELIASHVDPITKTLVAELTHFSTYVLVEKSDAVTLPSTNPAPSVNTDTTASTNESTSVITSVPNTGDTSSTAFYILLLTLACGCILIPLFKRKGRNNAKNS